MIMAVEERVLFMADRMCHCGGRAVERIGTVPYTILGKRILLHNVPHDYCSSCNTYTTDINLKITPLLKYAYLNNVGEIEYNEEKI